ncbi:OmpA family protein [Luteimonas sp. RD2P54]|uniref:OmpA family protein n=1 Tax=Luteimonas endophytica TaxID=3042023 RepID=A0ABT6JC17_9GAMM|nr:OmpA family protein [Luteimonas endophytica]MDH5824371.1 OmpA family protein [Luteimonas endophytica]
MKSNLALTAVATAALALSACTTTPPPPPEPAAPPPAPSSFLEKLGADGLFAFGKSSLDDFSPEGQRALDELATRLTSGRPLEIVHVIGHSDRIGSDQGNLRLSTQRAEAVREYLIDRGVPEDRITAVGRGSVEPMVECEGDRGQEVIDCLAPNRRVEVRVHFAD